MEPKQLVNFNSLQPFLGSVLITFSVAHGYILMCLGEDAVSKIWSTQWPSEVSYGGLKLCLTLCNPMDYSLPGSSVHRFLQARILEWVAISFSRGSSQPKDRSQVSCTAGGFFYPLSHQ